MTFRYPFCAGREPRYARIQGQESGSRTFSAEAGSKRELTSETNRPLVRTGVMVPVGFKILSNQILSDTGSMTVFYCFGKSRVTPARTPHSGPPAGLSA